MQDFTKLPPSSLGQQKPAGGGGWSSGGWDGLGPGANPVANAATATIRRWEIAFTGSGSEYFRIWIVNLLLTLVTLGLYLPFAKARRIQYFYANTRVNGYALSFHGRPWLMFRGWLLVLVFGGAYAVAGKFSETAGLVALGLFYAVYPALWRAGLQFRLANTGWRGLRMYYAAGLWPVYRAALPVFMPAVIFLAGYFLLFRDDSGISSDTEGTIAQVITLYHQWAGVNTGLTLLLLPLSFALAKRVQHGGYGYAQQRGQLDVAVWSFYRIVIRSLSLSIAILLTLLLGWTLVAWIAGWVSAPELADGHYVGRTLGYMVVFCGPLLLLFLIYPYGIWRLQDLLWNGTRSQSLQFHSALRFKTMAWLNAKNLFLVALTLGLYRPFAAVNMARLRLEAVTLTVTGDVDAWVDQNRLSRPGATGDAAGDFFGIDLGL